MKRKVMVRIGMAAGMLLIGSMSAFAADCGGRSGNEQALEQFARETADLKSALKAKEAELSKLNLNGYWGIERGYDGPDYGRINQLEAERNEIKAKIGDVATRFGIRSCCAS